MLAMPFEKFERKRFFCRLKDLSMVRFAEPLWRRLTEKDRKQLAEAKYPGCRLVLPREYDKKQCESSRAKLRTYLRANVGRVIESADLREASGNAGEWARRVRELRSEEGYPLATGADQLAVHKSLMGKYREHARKFLSPKPKNSGQTDTRTALRKHEQNPVEEHLTGNDSTPAGASLRLPLPLARPYLARQARSGVFATKENH